jgi:cytochrome d ubiquinol oxidase subunit I
MEGHYRTQAGAPLHLIGWPDSEAAETRYAISIPKAGSLILHHDANARLLGLDNWPREDWPNVPLVFWSFRVMVGIGFAMAAIGVWSLAARLRGRLYDATALQRAAVWMGPAGFVAVLAGWIVPIRSTGCCAPPIRHRRWKRRPSAHRSSRSSWSTPWCSGSASTTCCA